MLYLSYHIMVCHFSQVFRVTCRNSCLQNNGKRSCFCCFMLTSNHSAITSNSNIYNISLTDEDKTDIGACPASLRVQRYLSDEQNLLQRVQFALIYDQTMNDKVLYCCMGMLSNLMSKQLDDAGQANVTMYIYQL